MTTRRTPRRAVGPKFSEAARRLWAEAESRFDGNQAALAESVGATSGMLSKWLWGDRKPSLRYGSRIETELGIPVALWDMPATSDEIKSGPFARCA
jgi:hypothetical protein